MHSLPHRRAGFTLVELAISMALVASIMAFMTVHLHREARGLREMQSMSHSERVVNDLLTKIEAHLDFAQGTIPIATLASPLPSGESFVVDLDVTAGFPDQGMFRVNPGSASDERVVYRDMDPAAEALLQLERGAQGGTPRSHAAGSPVLWNGAAAVLEEQIGPLAGTFDGQSREMLADLFYRGDGTGFSFRVPTDPGGGTNFLTPTGVRWGATVGGRPTEDGRACVYFQPVAQITEQARGFDFNRDGDLLDTFDLGQIRHRAWDAVDGDNISGDTALSPPIILQQLNAWGSDLDNDGFQDPIFLWTAASGRLRIRFFALVGSVNQREVVKRFETVLHLRNGASL